MKKPLVAIVGRPNTGKSTFFNKVVGKRISIVKDEPGVTRDRIYADAEWLNYKFTLVDTGGIDLKNTTSIQKNITNQAKIAIELADVILLFVDGIEGYTEADNEVADILRKSRKPVIVVVNKIDNIEKSDNIYDFYQLGLDNVFGISSEQSKGIGDLLDEVVKNFPQDLEIEETKAIKIAVVGKPNAGKSSITNRLLGEERVVVSNVAGTTRDAIDTPFKVDGEDFVIIDTAGLRKKRSIEFQSVEQYSVLRALEAIKRADVCLIVIDSTEGLTEQDLKIAGYVYEQGKPSIIVVNKWDAIPDKDAYSTLKFEEVLKNELNFMDYYVSVYISALTGQRTQKIIPLVKQVYENYNKRIKTSILNELIQNAVSMNQPPIHAGKRLKIYFASQTATCPPTFTFQVNDANLVHFSYERYLENCIRRSVDFKGTPIKLQFISKPTKEL
ncbi:MAG: ribosome biogenesis GTPase Der [Clostridia bacterium]|nr:ribosome biogenesis GTPase Der [Clostridia bacterium]